MTWDQWLIVICGPTAVALSMCRTTHWRRWAPLVGLAAQPAWFYATYSAGQWGMFGVSIVYASAWLFGVYNLWIRRSP